jgi:SNW domain-containing protein 1
MSFLPTPKHKYSVLQEDNVSKSESSHVLQSRIPPLGQRVGFIPSNVEDFEDGGAFPEIHVVQYPLNMGKPGSKSTAVVAVDVDEKGEVKFDAIIKQGSNKNKIVQSSFEDIKEKDGDKAALAMPALDEEAVTAERTRLALEALLDSKIKKSKPTTIANTRTQTSNDEPTYIRYTPNVNAPG